MKVAAFRPFRHRIFSITWTASLVSNIGTWMQTVAVGALVRVTTGQALWTAVVFVASFVPNGLLAPVGGALADRLDRRRFIIAATSVETVLAAVLAFLVAHGHDGPGIVTAVVFVAGSVAALRQPFQQALLPDLVPREDFVGASALGSTQWNMGRVVGPAAAGVVIAVGSYSLAFLANAISFLAVIVAFVIIRLPRHEPHEEWAGIGRHIRAGARATRDEPGCRAAVLLIAFVATIAAPFIALVAARAADLVGPTATKAEVGAANGALTTGQGIGAVIGALLLADLVERLGRRRVLVVAMVVTAASLAAFGLAPSLPLALASLVVLGGAYISILSGLSAVVQLRAPEAYRGRILSLYFGTLSITFPIGALVEGAIGDHIGLGPALAGAAALLLIGLAVIRTAWPGLLDDLGGSGREVVEEPVGLVAQPDAGVP